MSINNLGAKARKYNEKNDCFADCSLIYYFEVKNFVGVGMDRRPLLKSQISPTFHSPLHLSTVLAATKLFRLQNPTKIFCEDDI